MHNLGVFALDFYFHDSRVDVNAVYHENTRTNRKKSLSTTFYVSISELVEERV